jgi:hypothetical protein
MPTNNIIPGALSGLINIPIVKTIALSKTIFLLRILVNARLNKAIPQKISEVRVLETNATFSRKKSANTNCRALTKHGFRMFFKIITLRLRKTRYKPTNANSILKMKCQLKRGNI